MKKMKNSILLLLTLLLIITATANLSPVYASPTALEVLPTPIVGSDKMPGYEFTVDINLTDVSGLSAFAFKLAYDPSVLIATAITKGGFFDEGIGSLPNGPVIEWYNEINNTLGYVWYALGFGLDSIYFATGKDGSGTLATVNFEVIGWGGTILDLVDTQLVDPNGDPMEWYEVYPGLFNNQKEAPVVESLEASLTEPQIGENVEFSAQAYDPDYPDPDGGIIESYHWDFGDGTAEYSVDRWGVPTPHTEHTYELVGTYVVKLTVTDNMEPVGAKGRASITITVTPPRGLKADIVDAFPEFRNIRTVWPPEEDWWRKDTHFNPFYADVVNLASESVTVKVKFTVTKGGLEAASFETDTYTFAAGSYLAEHRFNTATDCSPPQFETNWEIGQYSVQATALYEVDNNKWVEGRTRAFKFKVMPSGPPGPP